MQRPGIGLARAADPLPISPTVNDPIAAELARLGVDLGLPVGRRAGVDLTRQQEHQLKQSKGRELRQQLQTVINDAGYRTLSDDEKRAVLERVVERTPGDVSRRMRRELGGGR